MVPRIVAWTLLSLVVGVLLLALLWPKNTSSANTPENSASHPEIGRFRIVRQSPEQIILLDTISGDLYKAGPDDIQPYAKLRRDADDGSKDSDEE